MAGRDSGAPAFSGSTYALFGVGHRWVPHEVTLVVDASGHAGYHAHGMDGQGMDFMPFPHGADGLDVFA